jgi:hypothetical protein
MGSIPGASTSEPAKLVPSGRLSASVHSVRSAPGRSAGPGSRRSSKVSRERDQMELRVCWSIPDPQIASWHLPSVRQRLHLLTAGRRKNREDVADCRERTCPLQGANDTNDVAPCLRPRRGQMARVAQKALRVP